jgi:hypothetical protein
MKRPLSRIRPVGPVFSESKFTTLGFRGEDEKEVVGVSGTPFPNQEKEDLLVIYVLGGPHIAFADRFESNVQRKINGRSEYDGYNVRFLKSGTSAAKQFKEQAVLVEIPSEDIATTRTDLDTFEGIIAREAEDATDSTVEIKEIIYEMKGEP